jgi:outer membrane lipoprotein-sorting protein
MVHGTAGINRQLMTPIRIFSLGVTAFFLSAAGLHAADKAVSADDLLIRSRAKYAALKSYADTGTVITEYNPGAGATLTERHKFTTYFRAPKQFSFEFKAESTERLAIWIDGAEVQSWWSATGVHDTYPQGQGASGFAMATLPTKGSVVQIASLLFPGLQSATTDLTEARLIGSESIGGKTCHKIAGIVALAYSNGVVTSTRPTTVWIDAESLLLRKIVEDTPRGSPGGIIDRVTTIFEPRANPDLKGLQFRFSIPASAQ